MYDLHVTCYLEFGVPIRSNFEFLSHLPFQETDQ